MFNKQSLVKLLFKMSFSSNQDRLRTPGAIRHNMILLLGAYFHLHLVKSLTCKGSVHKHSQYQELPSLAGIETEELLKR